MSTHSPSLPVRGDRVQITGRMQNEAHPLPVGTTGTVVFSDQLTHQIFVDWDIDRSLILLTEDPFTVIDHNQGVS